MYGRGRDDADSFFGGAGQDRGTPRTEKARLQIGLRADPEGSARSHVSRRRPETPSPIQMLGRAGRQEHPPTLRLAPREARHRFAQGRRARVRQRRHRPGPVGVRELSPRGLRRLAQRQAEDAGKQEEERGGARKREREKM